MKKKTNNCRKKEINVQNFLSYNKSHKVWLLPIPSIWWMMTWRWWWWWWLNGIRCEASPSEPSEDRLKYYKLWCSCYYIDGTLHTHILDIAINNNRCVECNTVFKLCFFAFRKIIQFELIFTKYEWKRNIKKPKRFA